MSVAEKARMKRRLIARADQVAKSGKSAKVRAPGGNWLARAASACGVSIKAVMVDGVPRPSIEVNGVTFVNVPNAGDRS